jgi:pSer/pThr/pTyr-binding forkhead associated (FHA) protein
MGMGNIVTDSARLLIKLHGQGSRTLELTGDSFTIGRKADNDLPIEDHTVSRPQEHEWHSGQW